MSDLLTNLVERTVMPEFAVRPKYISPYEQILVPQIALEPEDEGFEQHFGGGSQIVDPNRSSRETSLIASEFEPEARREEVPRTSHIDFEVLKPHATVRNDDDTFHDQLSPRANDQNTSTFDSSLQTRTPESSRSSISNTVSLSPRTVLKLERQSTRTSGIGESFRHLNDEGRLDQRDDVRAATPSSITIRIGRVEVRATTGASSHSVDRRLANRPQTTQRPSLDEYLERKSKRR